MLDSLRHVRLDIRTGTRRLTALARVAAGRSHQALRFKHNCTGMFLIALKLLFHPVVPKKSGSETTRPVAVTRDGSCLFNSVLAVDPVGQGQRR